MAKSASRLTRFNAFEPGGPVVSPSISPPASSVTIVRVLTYENTTCSVSGLGLTWTTAVNGQDVTDTAKVWVFYAYGSPSTGTITVTTDGGAWIEASVENVSGTVNSTTPVVQVVVNSGTNNNLTSTLAAFGNASNGTMGIGLVGDNRSITQGSGFSSVVANAGGGLFDFSDILEFKDSNDTGVDASFASDPANWWMVAIEIGDSGGAVNNYTITAAQGTYTLTGQTASLLTGGFMTAEQGSYTLLGSEALRDIEMDADLGSYALNGQNGNVVSQKIMTASPGSYTLIGQSAALISNIAASIQKALRRRRFFGFRLSR